MPAAQSSATVANASAAIRARSSSFSRAFKFNEPIVRFEKLRIEQNKSRPRRSNDNGLVETKDGA